MSTKASNMMREVIIQSIFLCFILIVSYSNQDSDVYRQHKDLMNILHGYKEVTKRLSQLWFTFLYPNNVDLWWITEFYVTLMEISAALKDVFYFFSIISLLYVLTHYWTYFIFPKYLNFPNSRWHLILFLRI